MSELWLVKSLRLETHSVGLSCRSRAAALCACSGRPAIALLGGSTAITVSCQNPTFCERLHAPGARGPLLSSDGISRRRQHR
jgi:hypothetical protein